MKKTQQDRISSEGRKTDFLPDLLGTPDGVLFEAFMENSPAQAWIADEDLNLYYMNRAYRFTFNLGEDALFKRPAIFRDEYMDLYIRNNRKVLAANTPLHTIEDGYDQNGTYKVFKVCKFPLGNPKGKPLLGGWMVDVTAELKAEKELQESNERYHYASMATSDKRKKLVKAVMQAQENERNAIGKELHDNVNQLLATARLMIDSARQFPEKMGVLLARGIELIGEALNENRKISHRLVAPSLDAPDFCDAVYSLASMLNLTGHIKADVELPPAETMLTATKELRLGVYRIIQEQVGNILKYSRASLVNIRFYKKGNAWKLLIGDNGIGFDVNAKRKGLGLKNIHSRVEVLGGKFRIITSPGNGCRIVVCIPG